MGYTHYWKYKNLSPNVNEKFFNVIMDIKVAMKNLPTYNETAGGQYPSNKIIICGGLGEGEPVFDMNEIWFNGDSTSGMEHETFTFNPRIPCQFDFCKTYRKPYDFMVCITLLSLSKHLTGFTFSSDGDYDDWEPAIKFYQRNIGKLPEHTLSYFHQEA